MAYQSEIELRVKIADRELRELERRTEQLVNRFASGVNPFGASGGRKLTAAQRREEVNVQRQRLNFVKDAVEAEDRLRNAKAQKTLQTNLRRARYLRDQRIKAAQDVARAEKKLAKENSRFRENLALGAGFPLLFGGGLGAVGGGIAGAVAGRGGDGFGLQILFSALGQQIDNFFSGVSEAATTVANSLGGTTETLEALGEAGIFVERSLTDQVQALEDAGRAVAAYDAVQKELTDTYGESGLQALRTLKAANEDASRSTSELNAVLQAELAPTFTLISDVSGAAAVALAKLVPVLNALLNPFQGTPDPARAQRVARQGRIDAGVRERTAQLETGQTVGQLSEDVSSLQRQTEIARLNNDLTSDRVVLLKQVEIITKATGEIDALEAETQANLLDTNLKQVNAAKIKKIQAQQVLDLARLEVDAQSAVTRAAEKANREQERTARAQERAARIAEREAERVRQRINGLRREREEIVAISAIKDKIVLAEAANDSQLLIKLQGEQRLRQLETERLNDLAKAKTAEEAQAINQTAIVKVLEAQLETGRQLTEDQRQRQELFDDTLEGLQRQLDMAEATSQAERDRLKIAREMKKLKDKGFTDDQVAQAGGIMERLAVAQQPLNAFIRKTTEDLNNLQQVAVDVSQGIGNAIGSSLVNGLQSLVTGAASIKEVFANMLKSVADVLANTAAKMIAQYIAIGIARAFAGMGSKGLESNLDSKSLFSTDLGLPAFGDIPSDFKFAQGGYVDGPTRALIGEGGQPEYVIPASKMTEAMSRYGRGARGSAVIPEGDGASTEGGMATGGGSINVNYSVERINNVDYVTAAEFERGMTQAAKRGAEMGRRNVYSDLVNKRSVRSRVGV